MRLSLGSACCREASTLRKVPHAVLAIAAWEAQDGAAEGSKMSFAPNRKGNLARLAIGRRTGFSCTARGGRVAPSAAIAPLQTCCRLK